MSTINGITENSIAPYNYNSRVILEGWAVEPGRAIGNVQLGMVRKDVKQAYPDKILTEGDDDPIDIYEELGLRIHYNGEGKVCFLEASPLMILFLNDELEVFSSNFGQICSYFKRSYQDAEEIDDELALTFDSYGISFVKGDTGEPPISVEVFPRN